MRTLFLLSILTAAAQAQVPGFSFTDYQIFTLPNASYPLRINDSGTVSVQGQGTMYLLKNGSLTPVSLPVAGAGLIFPFGLNASGDIVGEYRDAGNSINPFGIIQGVFVTYPDVNGGKPRT